MRTLRLAAQHSLLALLGATTAVGQPAAVEDTARAWFAARGILGGQVTVILNGRVAQQFAIGLADAEAREPVTNATRFRIGSVSKLLTATTAALLWERGTFDLDAPVHALVPEFPEHPGVTARRLAGHIGGVRHYIGKDFSRPPTKYEGVVPALDIFRADSLVAPPGTRYHYTSYGYNLLGATIERAAKEEYRALVARLVLRPLRLSSVVAERSDSAIAHLSRGYDPAPEGTPRLASRTDLSDRWPSGGWLATATDIATLAEASVRGPFLSNRIRTLLFTPMSTADGTSTKVGFGWRVGTDPSGRVVYHHGGNSTGGRAMLMVWRDQPLSIAITTNVSNARISEADAMTLGRLLLGSS